jgi:hypothetical protein
MENKKVIYIGGKQIGVNCLRILLKKGIRPELVIANMDDNGQDTWHESIVKLSKKSNLSLIQNTRLSDKKLQKQIIESNADIIFSIGGTHLIPEVILKAPKLGCFNIHPALLPKYRGRYSTVHALFNGEKNIDVIVGGPPCQGFSMAGRRIRNGGAFLNDPRNELFKEFIRVVKDINPKIFVMENVAAILNIHNGAVKDEIINKFKEIGYETRVHVLLAAEYGVPQLRKRAVFIGTNWA